MKLRILFIAMANSVHTARWISQLSDQGWDIHLFPVEERKVHPALRNVTVHNFLGYKTPESGQNVRLASTWPFSRGTNLARRVIERFVPLWKDRAWRLARTIQLLRPDMIHSLEMQHAGYLTLEAKNHLDDSFPPWIFSSWGSDIFYFGRQPEHQERIRAVLTTCDYYIADCQRDVSLAKTFGFKREALGVFPVPGGFDIRHMQQKRQPTPVSSRQVIALKGYHADDWAGRALVALQAIHICADILGGYEIVVYLATPNVRYAAEYVARITGLHITVLPHSPHDEIIKLMGRARIAIGVSVTDGTPNTMLEAMVMGAFPIQSDTISTAEWITHGENGLLVPPEDPEAIAVAIRCALFNDDLVDRAAKINARITAKRIDRTVIQPQVIAMYKKVTVQGKQYPTQPQLQGGLSLENIDPRR